MTLKGKTIVFGVTGGIAAYKSCETVSSLKKAGADVFVVMTQNAEQFVPKLTFETLSGNRVISDMWDRNFEWEVEHISLAKRADIFVVAPCTANVAAKLAHGIADDFLTTTAMAMTCPILLAPAMNVNMFSGAAYRENENILKRRGIHFIYGGEGRLACGDIGKGRMAEPAEISQTIASILGAEKDFAGKRILITAGATEEPIDPVRYITNRSSGKMGCALADAATDRGADVVLVHGRMSVRPQNACTQIYTQTTADMYEAVMKHAMACDIIIKAAAPSDYTVVNRSNQKIKRTQILLELEKNPDIAAEVGKIKGNRILVVFAAETEDLIRNAEEKRKKKNADMIVANDVTMDGAGFETDTNIVKIITADTCEEIGIMQKAELADLILDRIQKM